MPLSRGLIPHSERNLRVGDASSQGEDQKDLAQGLVQSHPSVQVDWLFVHLVHLTPPGCWMQPSCRLLRSLNLVFCELRGVLNLEVKAVVPSFFRFTENRSPSIIAWRS